MAAKKAKPLKRVSKVIKKYQDDLGNWVFEEASGIKRNNLGHIVNGSRAINLNGRGSVSNKIGLI